MPTDWLLASYLVGSADGSGVFSEEANLLKLSAFSAEAMLIVSCRVKEDKNNPTKRN